MKWLLYTCCCFVAMMNMALPTAFGTMFVPLLDRYGESRAKTATVQAVLMGIENICCLMSGWLVGRIGVPRVSLMGSMFVSAGFLVASFTDSIVVLDIAIGAVAGTGVTMIYMPSTVVIGQLFEKSAIKTARAFQMFCMGIGIIVFPYILDAVSAEYGVSGAFLIISGIFLNNIVFALVFYVHEKMYISADAHLHAHGVILNRNQNAAVTRNPANDEGVTQSTGLNGVVLSAYGGTNNSNVVFGEFEQPVNNGNRRIDTADNRVTSELTGLQRLRAEFAPLINVQFRLVTLAAGLLVSAISGFLVVVMDLLEWKDISSTDSLGCFTAYTIGTTASRGFFTLLSKVVSQYNSILASSACAVCGCVGQLLILFSHHVYFVYVGMALTGVSMGGTYSNAVVIVGSILHPDLFALGFGFIMAVVGLLSMATGPLYGYIRDDVRSYEGALIITTAMLGVAAVLFSAVVILRQWTNRRMYTKIDTAIRIPDTS